MATGIIELAPQIPLTTEETRFVKDHRVEWNGIPEERERAKALLERVIGAGGALVAAWTGPHTAVQVRSFSEVETIEQEKGTVTVTVTPQVRGG